MRRNRDRVLNLLLAISLTVLVALMANSVRIVAGEGTFDNYGNAIVAFVVAVMAIVAMRSV